MKNILEQIKQKHDLSFLEKMEDSDVHIFAFGGLLRDMYLDRYWDDVDLRVVYNTSRKEREQYIETVLEEYGLEGKTVIEDLNLTVYRFLPEASILREHIDLSLVPTLDDNLPDFTINSLFFDLKTQELLDRFNGQKDLDARVIRTVKPVDKHFTEEPHMMFRAIKFACQLGFEIEEDTLVSIKNNKEKIQETLSFIKDSQTGIFVELFLGNIFKGLKADPIAYFDYLNKTGMYQELVRFCANNLQVDVPGHVEIKIQNKDSYEKNLSYLFNSILDNLEIQDKKEGLRTLLDIFAISSEKSYSDFNVDTEQITVL